MSAPGKLEGKNAVITGASQGLGKAIAEQFVREGAKLVICARNEPLLAKTAEELTASGGTVYTYTCDVSDEKSVEGLAAFAFEKLGRVDALVCNAGIVGPIGPTESVSIHEWMETINVNLLGTLLPCRALIPHFKLNKSGKIVILSGGGATKPMPNFSAYAASKAGVVRLMETLAEELQPFGIDVNAVAPGALKTRILDQVIEAGPERAGESYHQKNVQLAEAGTTPLEKGASLCAYLASTLSDGISGRLISAPWDKWEELALHREELAASDIYTLRRIIPEDRGKNWSN